MIDLCTYPDEEDLSICFNRIMAQLRDSLGDLEQLFKRMLEGRTYISQEELCTFLRCKRDEIPERLPRYRIGQTYLYQVKEILEFLDSKRIPKKKEN